MNNTKHIIKKLFVLSVIALMLPYGAKGYNLRQFSSKNGLSNSAILSIYQDQKGFMWFGSCDGLNMFDGLNIEVYKPTSESSNPSGNLIESIIEAENDIFWIQTNYGLDRLDKRGQTIKSFKEFKSKNHLAKSMENDIFIIKEDKFICYFHPEDNAFKKIFLDEIYFDNILDIVISGDNTLWIFSKEGTSSGYIIEKSNESIDLSQNTIFEHDKDLLYCFHEGNTIYFIDNSYVLYEYDLLNRKKYYICDLRNEINLKGKISSIIKYHDDFYIGFKTNGLIRLKNIPEQKNNYEINEIDIKSGIFCLVKDRYQDVIWVGTDGQGVYMYFIDSYSIKSTTFGNLAYPVNNPVRSLFLDKENTLWIGTKGDGILKILNYRRDSDINNKTEHFSSANSELDDNSVYTFANSNKNILWIGNENGINYYSYKEKRIKKINIQADGKPVRYVHSICEFNDSTIWIATVGEGIVKASLSGTKDSPVISGTKRIVFDKGNRAYNYFFTTYKENDSIIWFGNRGYGAFRLNTITESIETFQFDKKYSNQTSNDIFAIVKNDEGYWFGTSFGLIWQHSGKEQVFNETSGFPNNTIHAILEDSNRNLWLSTNRGVVKFNITQKTFQTYNQQNELEVTEFSDGAYYKDKVTGTLFMGGINGFVTISENDYVQKEFNPAIQFNKLSIFGKEHNIFDFLTDEKDNETLELDFAQNFFSISFTAIDYINGNNYTYSYKLDELSNNWIENGISNTATFSGIPPGLYTLYVKYKNRITGNESPVYTLLIKVNPPWYQTNIAQFIYLLISIILVFSAISLIIKWYKMKKNSMIERLNRQQKEEVYESKLRFFTNITHELCTPLTLIYGPCEKIISYAKTDGYIHKYASLIQYNAEKLNTLIHELIEFRRLETGNKTLDIRQLQISDIIKDIAGSFIELAETKKIDYTTNIDKEIVWNSDNGCLNKIVVNLISNAFKYTPDNGKIRIAAHIDTGFLNIIISNTGKGIKEKNISEIFDRYKILDNFEISGKNGLTSRNGLGLAICHSMVKLLNGEIIVTSIPNELTVFSVKLPIIETNTDVNDKLEEKDVNLFVETPISLENSVREYDKSKSTIMIIDDDPAMLWFVTEIFIENYNILPINDADMVMPTLKQNIPDLIISDVMMPYTDGISLTKSVKSDKLLSHIPLILLSAKNDPEEQIKGIESGAEIYLTKPFNVKYLEKIVDRILQRKKDLKEYYNSSLSSYELDNGQFMHKEEKAFFEKILQVIDSNITNPKLSVELLGSSLGYSSRQLNRKLKNFTDKTPNDIIREYRLSVAERLLVTTNLSVDEILYKSGFSNRGNFFKIFYLKYNMTPRNYREYKKKEFEDFTKP